MATDISRRSLVTGAAALAAATAVAATASPAAPARADDTPDDDIQWDATYDLIVAGTGCGAFAAFYAADLGAQKVALLEKDTGFGGTAKYSGGVFWVPVNHYMTDLGYEDNAEDALTFMRNCGEGRQNDPACQTFVNRVNDWVEWTEKSIGWQFAVNDVTAYGYRFGAFNEYFDYEGYREFGRSLTVYGSSKDPDFTGGSGATEWMDLRTQAEEHENIDLQYEVEVAKLYTNADGEVVGVLANTPDGPRNYRATQGVVLATGGFDFNEEMRRRYLKVPIFNSTAVHTSTGDGQRMGLELHAKLGLMCNNWGAACAVALDNLPRGAELTDFSWMQSDMERYDAWCRRGFPNSIVVNPQGKRFANESANYHGFNRAFEGWNCGTMKPANYPAYWIGDADFFANYELPMTSHTDGEGVGVLAAGTSVFDTLEEVAEAIGVDYETLKKTIDEFNANAEMGVDPDFERGEHVYDRTTTCDRGEQPGLANPSLGPVAKPPFYVNAYLPGSLGTNGGMVIDERSRVIREDGEAIPRLYAVGNCTACIAGNGYGGAGYTLALGATEAFLAAEDAMALEPLA